MSSITNDRLLQETDPVEKMYKEFRAWAMLSLLLGGISIFSGSNLDPVWGVVMIIVAVLSWKVRIPGMFAVYAVVMGWAAVMNTFTAVINGERWWLMLAVFQVGWTISIVRRIKIYSQLHLEDLYLAGKWPAGLTPPQNEVALANRFSYASVILSAISAIPWMIFSLACAGLVLLALLVLATQPLPVAGTEATPVPVEDIPMTGVNYFCSGIIYLAVLGLGFGLAALVSRTTKQKLALIGIITSSIFLTMVIILWIIGAFSQALTSLSGG